MKPILLDMFCGAGGATKGYQMAGFEVWGVDNKPQPRYCGDRFFQDDALDFLANNWKRFDAVHASPPCQTHSALASIHRGTESYKRHLDLIPQTRALLKAIDKPYVIENVPRSPLQNPMMLCGTMFGLRVLRHRLFECNPPVYFAPAPCCHQGKTQGFRGYGSLDEYEYLGITSHRFKLAHGRIAMGIDWMNEHELCQAIPPKYTEFLGKQLMRALGAETPQELEQAA